MQPTQVYPWQQGPDKWETLRKGIDLAGQAYSMADSLAEEDPEAQPPPPVFTSDRYRPTPEQLAALWGLGAPVGPGGVPVQDRLKLLMQLQQGISPGIVGI